MAKKTSTKKTPAKTPAKKTPEPEIIELTPGHSHTYRETDITVLGIKNRNDGVSPPVQVVRLQLSPAAELNTAPPAQ